VLLSRIGHLLGASPNLGQRFCLRLKIAETALLSLFLYIRKFSITASLTKHDFDVCLKDIQYTLYKKNETIILFLTTVNNILCKASLVFKPFRCPRSYFIFYSYKICCILSLGVFVEVVAL
jgi:hypothetical protein